MILLIFRQPNAGPARPRPTPVSTVRRRAAAARRALRARADREARPPHARPDGCWHIRSWSDQDGVRRAKRRAKRRRAASRASLARVARPLLAQVVLHHKATHRPRRLVALLLLLHAIRAALARRLVDEAAWPRRVTRGPRAARRHDLLQHGRRVELEREVLAPLAIVDFVLVLEERRVAQRRLRLRRLPRRAADGRPRARLREHLLRARLRLRLVQGLLLGRLLGETELLRHLPSLEVGREAGRVAAHEQAGASDVLRAALLLLEADLAHVLVGRHRRDLLRTNKGKGGRRTMAGPRDAQGMGGARRRPCARFAGANPDLPTPELRLTESTVDFNSPRVDERPS